MWAKTVFILNYDENDGLFDHVVPPDYRRPARRASSSPSNELADRRRASGCRASSSRRGPRAAGSPARPSTTPRRCSSSSAHRRDDPQHHAVAPGHLRQPDLGVRAPGPSAVPAPARHQGARCARPCTTSTTLPAPVFPTGEPDPARSSRRARVPGRATPPARLTRADSPKAASSVPAGHGHRGARQAAAAAIMASFWRPAARPGRPRARRAVIAGSFRVAHGEGRAGHEPVNSQGSSPRSPGRAGQAIHGHDRRLTTPMWRPRAAARSSGRRPTGTILGSYSADTPEGVAVTPDDSQVFIAETGQYDVIADVHSRPRHETPIEVGAYPQDVAASPDGARVYATLTGGDTGPGGSDQVAVINAATDAVTGDITVGTAPRQVAFSPDGTRAYVTTENGVDVIVTPPPPRVIRSYPEGAGAGSRGQPEWRDGVRDQPDAARCGRINAASGRSSRACQAGRAVLGHRHALGSTLYVADMNSDSVDVISAATGRSGRGDPRRQAARVDRDHPGRLAGLGRQRLHRRRLGHLDRRPTRSSTRSPRALARPTSTPPSRTSPSPPLPDHSHPLSARPPAGRRPPVTAARRARRRSPPRRLSCFLNRQEAWQ